MRTLTAAVAGCVAWLAVMVALTVYHPPLRPEAPPPPPSVVTWKGPVR